MAPRRPRKPASAPVGPTARVAASRTGTPGGVTPGRTHRLAPLLLAVAVLTGSLVGNARELYANGGALRLAEVPIGRYTVSVFTDPTPVRPGQLDVSVLAVRPGEEGVVEGLDIRVRAQPAAAQAGSSPQERRATREQAEDPRYYVARFELDEEGLWDIDVMIRGEHGEGTLTLQVSARERGWLGHPAIVAVLALLPLCALAYWAFRKPAKIS